MSNAASFTKVSTAFIIAPNISLVARAIYHRLAAYHNRTTGQCNPRVTRLAVDLGVSDSTVKRGLRELRQDGWIVSHRRMRGSAYILMEVAKPSHQVTGDPMHQVTGDPMHGVMDDPMGTSASLFTEPDLKEPEGVPAAAVKASGCRATEKPPKPAAAAPPPSLKKLPEKPPTGTPANEVREQVSNGGEKRAVMAAALVEELHTIHPQPGLADKAIPEVERILANAADVEATVKLIRDNHAAWKLHWEMARPGQFIPQLWRWFHDNDWKRTVGKPVRHETYYERLERKNKEEDHSEFLRFCKEKEAEDLMKRWGWTREEAWEAVGLIPEESDAEAKCG